MKDYIEERAVEIACYIIENKGTVRQAAKKFGISKSTVHKDCTERLIQINPTLGLEVRQVLDRNKSERHIRGGIATREKYLLMHEKVGQLSKRRQKDGQKSSSNKGIYSCNTSISVTL